MAIELLVLKETFLAFATTAISAHSLTFYWYFGCWLARKLCNLLLLCDVFLQDVGKHGYPHLSILFSSQQSLSFHYLPYSLFCQLQTQVSLLGYSLFSTALAVCRIGSKPTYPLSFSCHLLRLSFCFHFSQNFLLSHIPCLCYLQQSSLEIRLCCFRIPLL